MSLVKTVFSFAILAVSYGYFTTPTPYSYCYSDDDCSGSQRCCRQRNKARKCNDTCLGHLCSVDDECASGEYCCEDTCRLSCLGYSCALDADCGGPDEYCCNYSCQKEWCPLPSGIIAAIVLAVLVVTATVTGIALFVYRFSGSQSSGMAFHGLPSVPATDH